MLREENEDVIERFLENHADFRLAILDRSQSDLSLGVRPEDIVIANGEGLPAVVLGVEYLGADSIMDCQVADQMV